ncbi:beta-trefoil DNA-binding domain-containing protein [Sporodiniella umbellata]|nr:beta-trefoil DNA-binding domain-containing protein [Sporodiniella umbellata]
MNYPELLLSDDMDYDMIYSTESLPSSWSSHSSMNDYLQQSIFPPSLFDTKQEDLFMPEPLQPATPSAAQHHPHSPLQTGMPSPNSHYESGTIGSILEESESESMQEEAAIRACQAPPAGMKEQVQHFLTHPKSERRVTVLTSKVAQKSYGTEKRFLCPPPSTLLSGHPSWWAGHQPPQLTIRITGEKSSHQGTVDWYHEGSLLEPAAAVAHVSQGQALSGNCVSKQLHISDSDDKRKRAQVQVDIQSAQGVPMGTFFSKQIKVISKPSKKRQSLRNMDLCIHHGSTVALFNRMRSQTISTKYLGVSISTAANGTCFVTRSTSWDPFVIWIVDPRRAAHAFPTQQSSAYPPPPAVALQPTEKPLALHYNQPVVLQCVTTGLVSPILVLRRVDKGSMVMGGNSVSEAPGVMTGGEYGDEALGDPVSQLHKVAFQIVPDAGPAPSCHETARWRLPRSSDPVSYLACMNDVVGMHRVNQGRAMVHAFSDPAHQRRRQSFPTSSKNKRRRMHSMNDVLASPGVLGVEMNGDCWTEDVSDAAVWTLVGTDAVHFHLSPSALGSQAIAPQVDQVHPGVIEGDCFSPKLTVWLGDVPCLTEFKSKHRLCWSLPDTTVLLQSQALQPHTHGYQLPVLLSHQDGSLYHTHLFYSF